jgi:hypothetical protein
MVQSEVTQNRSRLYELCGQFEQVLLSSLLPQSIFSTRSSDAGDDQSATMPESGQSAAIFTQALAAAIERAGGLGLGHEMFRVLAQDSR